MDGVIVVDKPSGWTSHDVVNRMRRLANTKRVGHLGTLDPFATGVLPVVIGKATRLQQFYVRNAKEYEGLIRFGFATDSYDRDGKPITEPREYTADVLYENYRIQKLNEGHVPGQQAETQAYVLPSSSNHLF